MTMLSYPFYFAQLKPGIPCFFSEEITNTLEKTPGLWNEKNLDNVPMLTEEGPFKVTIISEETGLEKISEHFCLRVAIRKGSETIDGTCARIFDKMGHEICIIDAT